MSIIEKAKNKLDMRSMISLPKQRDCGVYLVACCPFHEDNHPSFLVYKDGWRCLSPNCLIPTGSVLDWIAHTQGNDAPTGSEIYKIAEDVVRLDNSPKHTVKIKHFQVKNKRRIFKKKLRPLDIKLAEKYWKLHDGESLKYLYNRGFTVRGINFYKFGLGGDAISIPIWEGLPGKSKLLSIRFRNLHDEPRYYGLRGYNNAELFNKFVVDILLELKEEAYVKMSEPLYVFFGEFDAALALSRCGIPAVSPTNGCETLKVEWFDGLDKIVIVPDYGEEDAANKAAAKIGVRAEVMLLPYRERFGKDFTEQWLMWPRSKIVPRPLQFQAYFKPSIVFKNRINNLIGDLC